MRMAARRYVRVWVGTGHGLPGGKWTFDPPPGRGPSQGRLTVTIDDAAGAERFKRWLATAASEAPSARLGGWPGGGSRLAIVRFRPFRGVDGADSVAP